MAKGLQNSISSSMKVRKYEHKQVAQLNWPLLSILPIAEQPLSLAIARE
jgi:hypothetical protein